MSNRIDPERRWHMVAIPDCDLKAYIEIGSGASMELTTKDDQRFTVAEIAGYPRVTKHHSDCVSFHPGRTCDGAWYTGALKDGAAMTRCCLCRFTVRQAGGFLEPTKLPGSGYRCTDHDACAERVREIVRAHVGLGEVCGP